MRKRRGIVSTQVVQIKTHETSESPVRLPRFSSISGKEGPHANGPLSGPLFEGALELTLLNCCVHSDD
jgi:hypothetical protein